MMQNSASATENTVGFVPRPLCVRFSSCPYSPQQEAGNESAGAWWESLSCCLCLNEIFVFNQQILQLEHLLACWQAAVICRQG